LYQRCDCSGKKYIRIVGTVLNNPLFAIGENPRINSNTYDLFVTIVIEMINWGSVPILVASDFSMGVKCETTH